MELIQKYSILSQSHVFLACLNYFILSLQLYWLNMFFLSWKTDLINLFKVTNLGRDSVDRWECCGSFQGINSTLKTSHRMHVSFCGERQKVFIQRTWFHVVPRLSTHIKYPQMKKKKVFKSHPWLCGKRINVVKILGLFEMHRRVIMMLWIRKVKLALGMKGRTWKFRVYCQS